jgi:hypothetical protein
MTGLCSFLARARETSGPSQQMGGHRPELGSGALGVNFITEYGQ